MTERELRARGSCDNCHHSGEEDWPNQKTALLCLHPGKYRGAGDTDIPHRAPGRHLRMRRTGLVRGI